MSLVRSIFTVGGYTLASRVLGLVRDLLTAALLGAGPMADAFFVAFRLPNLFRRLFAEGAFAAAFVPMFARTLEADGHAVARRFAEQALAMLVAILLVLTVAAELAMPWLVLTLAPGFADDPDKLEMAVEFSRITFPYLLFTAAMALMGGVLNGLYRFGAAAAAPIVLNLCMIAALLFLGDVTGSTGHALSWGVAAAGVGQCLLLMVAMRNAGMVLRPVLPRFTPQVRRLLTLMAPGAIGAGVMQFNLLIGTVIASLLPTGAVAYLYYADRLYQLPLGVIGIAVGTALLPRLSRELRGGDAKAAAHTTNRALEVALLFALPSSAALLVLAGPIVSVLFERGAFAVEDSAATAWTLAAYAVGLPAFVLVKVLAPAFFAREDTRTPVIVAAWTVAANIAFSLALVFPFEHVGLALATSLASWINAGWLAIGLRRRGFLTADARLLRAVPRIVAASLAMAGAVAALAWPLAGEMHGGSLTGALMLAMICIVGAGVFFSVSHLTGATNMADLRRHMRRRPPGA